MISELELEDKNLENCAQVFSQTETSFTVTLPNVLQVWGSNIKEKNYATKLK